MPSLKTIKTKIKSTGNLKIAHDQNKSITKKSFISMYLSSIQKNKGSDNAFKRLSTK